MDYEYIRKLTVEISADISIKIVQCLLEKGIEIYEKAESGSYKAIEQSRIFMKNTSVGRTTISQETINPASENAETMNSALKNQVPANQVLASEKALLEKTPVVPCIIYVSAADLEYARACVEELGLKQYLCEIEESQVVKSAAEAAEEEYYKKRKIRLIECAVVILLGAVYMIWKSLAG